MSTSHISPDTITATDTKPPPDSDQLLSTTKKSRLNPIWQARLKRFKSNRLGFISLIIFTIIFVICMAVNVIANDKPLMVQYDGGYYFPVAKAYP